jgi:hypothetical protein
MRSLRTPTLAHTDTRNMARDTVKPQRLLEIFRQLQAGEITEDEAVRALEVRRERRYGRVGRFLEAITS